jgi:hypothetical protein
VSAASPPLDVPLPDDPRIRDLRVTPHSLDGYDRLSGPLRTTTMSLGDQLRALGLRQVGTHLDGIIDQATKKRWGPPQRLEHLADQESADRSRRFVERRLNRSRVGRFKPMSAFDWLLLTTNLAFSAWPTVFPNASCRRAYRSRRPPLRRHRHRSDSYRKREAEADAKARKKRPGS